MFLLVVTDKTAHFDTLKFICHVFAHERSLFWSCLGVLANTPGGVKRSGLGVHAVGLLVVY